MILDLSCQRLFDYLDKIDLSESCNAGSDYESDYKEWHRLCRVSKILFDEGVWVFHTFGLSCVCSCDLAHSGKAFSICEVIEICASAIAGFVNECENGKFSWCLGTIWSDGSFSHLAKFIVGKIIACNICMLKCFEVRSRDGVKSSLHKSLG